MKFKEIRVHWLQDGMAKDKSPSNADGIGEIGAVASRTTSKFYGWVLLTPWAPLTPHLVPKCWQAPSYLSPFVL